MVAHLRLNQTEGVTLQEIRPWVEALVTSWWAESGADAPVLPTLSVGVSASRRHASVQAARTTETVLSLLELLAQAAEGRHWRHTLADLAIMNALITGPEHPDWLQITAPITHRPDLIAWIDQHRQLVKPDLLRLFVLLHDVGKAIQLAGHEEISYQLLKGALGRDFALGTEEALLALAIRYHAILGSIETGMASPVALLPLIEAIQHDPGQTEPLLTALSLMAITEFAVYDVLDEIILEGILAQAGSLRRTPLVVPSPALRRQVGASYDPQQIRLQLWEEARQQTFWRLGRLLFLNSAPLEPAQLVSLEAGFKGAAGETYANLVDFQRRFALLWVEAGYALFEHLLKTVTNLEELIRLEARLLGRWLPTPEQVTALVQGETPFFIVDLRAVGGFNQKSLSQLEIELANLKPVCLTELLPNGQIQNLKSKMKWGVIYGPNKKLFSV